MWSTIQHYVQHDASGFAAMRGSAALSLSPRVWRDVGWWYTILAPICVMCVRVCVRGGIYATNNNIPTLRTRHTHTSFLSPITLSLSLSTLMPHRSRASSHLLLAASSSVSFGIVLALSTSAASSAATFASAAAAAASFAAAAAAAASTAACARIRSEFADAADPDVVPAPPLGMSVGLSSLANQAFFAS